MDEHTHAAAEERVGALGSDGPPATPSGQPAVGSRWSTTELPHENHLLNALPADTRDELLSKLERLELDFKYLVWEPNESIEHVYFPLNGVVSLISIMADGSAVEVGTIGNEGFVGLPVFLGADRAPVRAFAQVAGEALRMRSSDFRAEANRNLPLREVLHRYTEAFFAMLSQNSACSRVHNAGQRMALWLLMVEDRVGTNVFPLTQEFLAQMMGVRRATVNEEAGRLQAQGIIDYRRGIINVCSRPGLEEAACECYRVIRSEYDRLLKPPA